MNPPRATAQQKGVNFKTKHFYTKNKVQEAESEFLWRLKPMRPSMPFDGAIEVNVTWFYPVKDKHKYYLPKITRPDIDNATKLLLDAMTKLGYWHDDAQVTKLNLEKYWMPKGGLIIEIKKHSLAEKMKTCFEVLMKIKKTVNILRTESR